MKAAPSLLHLCPKAHHTSFSSSVRYTEQDLPTSTLKKILLFLWRGSTCIVNFTNSSSYTLTIILPPTWHLTQHLKLSHCWWSPWQKTSSVPPAASLPHRTMNAGLECLQITHASYCQHCRCKRAYLNTSVSDIQKSQLRCAWSSGVARHTTT